MEKESQRQLTILTEIAEGRPITQRAIAEKMGMALGLVNLYLKRLVRKGYVKVSTIPSNRIKYLLTPKGVAEKARLTYEYMAYSLHLYRQTRKTLREGLEPLLDKGVHRIAIYGTSEAAELTFLTLRELGLDVSAIISENGGQGSFLGIPVCRLSDISPESLDLIILAGFPLEKPDVRALKQHGIPDRKIFSLYP
jgi:DNA-binding MarR family transcriptional regulator